MDKAEIALELTLKFMDKCQQTFAVDHAEDIAKVFNKIYEAIKFPLEED